MSIGNIKFGKARLSDLFSVRARLALVALILVFPLMLDRVNVLESSRATQIRAASAELAKVSNQSAQAQRDAISSVEALLKSAAYIHVAAERVGRGCAILRASMRVDLALITSLSVVGSNGRIQCSTVPQFVGLDVSDRSYFQKATETHDFALGDYVINKITKLPTLVAAFPTSAFDGGEEAVVLATISMKWLGDILSGLEGRPGVLAMLIDSRGVVLAARRNGPAMVGQQIEDQALLNFIAGGDSGSATLDLADGSRRTVSYTRIAGTDARMIVSVDETKMLGAIDRDIRSAYLQLGLVGILVLLGAWFLSEQLLIRPISALTSTALRFGQGDLSARNGRNNLPPEFLPLATAFNVMAAQLAERERELRASNNQLTVLASIDPVSGLANRRGFDSRLNFEWMKAEQSNQPLALLMIDIDHFKLYNDTYGHLEGDQCLRRVSGAIAEISNEVAGFAARYGGEEFSILLPGVDVGRAAEIGEMVRAAIESLGIAHVSSMLGHVTVSIGISHAIPSSEQQPWDLVETADLGLYAAKRRGRNAVVEHGAIRAIDREMAKAC